MSEDRSRPHLLAPIDVQVIKACGVTFVESMIERVIEERCGGDFNRAAEVRKNVAQALGGSLDSLRRGSEQAALSQELSSPRHRTGTPKGLASRTRTVTP